MPLTAVSSVGLPHYWFLPIREHEHRRPLATRFVFLCAQAAEVVSAYTRPTLSSP